MSSTPWVCSPLPDTLPKEPSRVKPLGKVTLPFPTRVRSLVKVPSYKESSSERRIPGPTILSAWKVPW